MGAVQRIVATHITSSETAGMRLPLTVMLLCSLTPFMSLADSEPSGEEQAPPAAEAAAPQPAETAARAPAPAAPSTASPAAPPAAAAAAAAATRVAAAEPDEDMTIVCKTERNVGTRFEKKTCRTRSAWQRIEKAAEEDFGAVRSRQMTCPDCRD